ncbi:hypothetical protein Ciccas_014223 [Cichlidogyrus casuarinus]|uniref:Uncharacterized protein n=1 Tax=Cichlidogyrus casuarinus TaxID=1844966 RepID=A0ABD2PKB8_9PLAT
MKRAIIFLIALCPLFVTPQSCADSGILIFDAGSTGTRPYLITAKGPASNMKLERYAKYKKSNLALSSITGTKDFPNLRRMLQTSIEQALKDIPTACRKQTGIILQATAGLRAISSALSRLILDEVKRIFELSQLKPISTVAAILSGYDEGLYYWVSVNFLKQTLATGDAKRTFGTMEIGGGSVQITAAIPRERVRSMSRIVGRSLRDVNILGKKYSVYSESFLNGGIQAARIKFFSADNKGFCLKQGVTVSYSFNQISNKILTGKPVKRGARRYCVCQTMASRIVRELGVKSFQGNLNSVKFIAGGVFYYNIHAIHSLEKKCDLKGTAKCNSFVHPTSLKDLRNYGKKYCSQFYIPKNLEVPFNVVYLCQDILYILELLENGWKFNDPAFEYTALEQINGHELSWVLGLGLQLAYEQLNSQ